MALPATWPQDTLRSARLFLFARNVSLSGDDVYATQSTAEKASAVFRHLPNLEQHTCPSGTPRSYTSTAHGIEALAHKQVMTTRTSLPHPTHMYCFNLTLEVLRHCCAVRYVPLLVCIASRVCSIICMQPKQTAQAQLKCAITSHLCATGTERTSAALGGTEWAMRTTSTDGWFTEKSTPQHYLMMS